MKRVLCGLLLGAAAFGGVPAHAADTGAGEAPVKVYTAVDDSHVFVGASYNVGHGDQPFGGAGVNRETGVVCAGLSYQVPQCVGGPID